MPSDHPSPEDLNALLDRMRAGDVIARDQVIALIYDELREAARRLMRHARPDHTLQPTALVNEAMLKLLAGDGLRIASDKRHLYRATVLAMRQVLMDHHRHRTTRKGPGRWKHHPLDTLIDHLIIDHRIDVEALDEALDLLSTISERACLVTTFHIFLGRSLPEVAEILDLSIATVERDWHFARAWLYERLKPDEG
ncbi:MAG: ECF-type sigma factor [Isosphaeraceae bacterium]